jgi:hypothetical protein
MVLAMGVAAGAISLMAGRASAGIEFYDIFFNTYFEQTSASAPTVASGYAFATRVIAQDAADLAVALNATPGPMGTVTLAQADSLTYVYFSSFYTNEAQWLSDWPAGTYLIAIDGGTAGALGGTLSRPSNLPYPSEIPAFDPGTWNAMQAMDSTQDFEFGLNTFSGPPPANLAIAFITIFDRLTGDEVYNDLFFASQGSYSLPAGALMSDHEYQATLYFSSRMVTTNGGLGGANGTVGVDFVTTAPLRTIRDCVADVDDGTGTGVRDGGVGIEDLLFYLFLYDLGDLRADVDDGSGSGTPDMGVGIEDLLYYLARYDVGC